MKYLLLIFLHGYSPTVVGPFDNLLACERAASQTQAAVHEAGMRRLGTTCVALKSPDFKYKEPGK